MKRYHEWVFDTSKASGWASVYIYDAFEDKVWAFSHYSSVPEKHTFYVEPVVGFIRLNYIPVNAYTQEELDATPRGQGILQCLKKRT